MPIETAPFVDSLNPAWPEDADPVEQGAAHLRLIKAALLASLPNLDEAVDLPARIDALEASRARRDIADTFAALMTFTVGATGASSDFTTVKQAGQVLVPPGTVSMYAGATAPGGWLLCDGAAVSRTTYADLFAALGTAYGAGNGTTTFNVPNFVDRYPIGVGAAARGSTLGSQTPTVVVASAGAHSHGGVTGAAGSHSHGGVTAGHALTEGQMPFHSHGVNDPGHVHGWSGFANWRQYNGVNQDAALSPGITASLTSDPVAASLTGISIAGAGGNQAHSHGIVADGNHQHAISSDGSHTHTATIADGRPPSLAVNFIIKV